MIRRLFPLILALSAVGFAGCGRDHDHEHEGAGAPPAAHETTPGQAAVGSEVQLAGTLGCGHCSFHVTNECAAVVKTASGEVYVLDGVEESSPLWEKRLDPGQTVAVAGTLAGIEPVKHVTVTSFEFN